LCKDQLRRNICNHWNYYEKKICFKDKNVQAFENAAEYMMSLASFTQLWISGRKRNLFG
jgi:hypothetical protein